MFLFLLFCCAEEKVDTSEPEPSAVPEAYQAEILLVDAINSQVLSGVTVNGDLDDNIWTTDDNGMSTTQVSHDFRITAQQNGYPVHHFLGYTNADFSLRGVLTSWTITEQLYGLMDLSVDHNKGILVVTLERPDLSPSVGAYAEIESDNAGAFVLGGVSVEVANTIPPNGSSVVTFPNVAPGLTTVTATGANGQTCRAFPNGDSSTMNVEVLADQVSVAIFVCE